MKILYTILSMGVKSGGPTLSTFLTAKGLLACGASVSIVTFRMSDISDRLISSDNFIQTLPTVSNKFGYSKVFKDFLLQESSRYDIVHARGIWSYPTYKLAKTARKQSKPYLITLHGMLYPQDKKKSRWKKKIFLKLYLFKDLQKAACVHATCMEEMEHVRNLGVISPIAVIPNPIETENMDRILSVNHKRKFRIGYLGRVHPRKNIERIIYAWNKLHDEIQDKELVIIGDGDDVYLQFLKKEISRLKTPNVIFTGFLSGKEKKDILQTLSYLVVPSDFENFGMIIPEALIQGVPVIASKGTPWEDLETYQCGWWVNNDVDTLVQTIRKAFSIPEIERIEMGKRGQNLIREKYSLEIVTPKMLRLYDWLLNGGEKPEFVYLD
jgi:glycosyltransferase involved in cell wall biosynthesis